MHELGLCDAIVQAALKRAGGRRVTSMRVRIGGHPVDPEVIRQGVLVAAAGSVAAEAAVDIVLDPQRARCRACGRETPATDHLALVACRGCGGLDIDLVGSEQAVLESVGFAASAAPTAATTEERATWTPSSC